MGRVWWSAGSLRSGARTAPTGARACADHGRVRRERHSGSSPAARRRRSPPRDSLRAPRRRRALSARATSLPAASIVASTFTAPGGEASCRFTTRGAGGARTLDVVAELDSAPQAFYRLEREVVEYGQNVLWHNEGAAAYPRDVAHLGLDADWLAAADQLITTDGVRLITILVNAAPAHAADGAEGIAASLARCYLGPLVPPRA